MHVVTPTGKKVRVRRCTAVLRIPADPTTGKGEAIFKCNKERHTADELHEEHGFILMQNDTVRRFTIMWSDEGQATLRQRQSSNVRRAARSTK